ALLVRPRMPYTTGLCLCSPLHGGPRSLPSTSVCFLFFGLRPPPRFTLFPYTTLFRSASPYADGVEYRAVEQAIMARGVEWAFDRSEEHTSELQSRENLVCRLLLEKKKAY